MNRIDHMLSESLRVTRSRFSDYRHGGVVLSSEEVEEFVQRLEAFVKTAEALEEAVAALQLVSTEQLTKTVSPASAQILHLMRPGTNVVPFPGNPHA